MATITDKRRAYRELHIGSARYLQHLGFKALATTSAGFAFSRGLPDNAVPREVMLAHIADTSWGGPQRHRRRRPGTGGVDAWGAEALG
jgi:Phosphoenolpyruvate phosphomutase